MYHVTEIAESVLAIEKRQCEALELIKFSDHVAYVYNPLDYARETHEYFVRTYCKTPKSVLFLGMNPGPFGMAQNGVPFGDSSYVNHWLNIKGNVYKPPKEHPKRQIYGLDCPRSEISGYRFWSYIAEKCGKPEKFFQNCYVHKYCPFLLMSSSSNNITPAVLRISDRKTLMEICDESLRKMILLLEVKIVVGVGKFAEERAREVLQKNAMLNVSVMGMMHPNPINSPGNKDWKEIAHKQLESADILKYL